MDEWILERSPDLRPRWRHGDLVLLAGDPWHGHHQPRGSATFHQDSSMFNGRSEPPVLRTGVAPPTGGRGNLREYGTKVPVHVAAPVATHASTQAISRSRQYQAVLASSRPQERYCAVATSTLPADRPPLRVEARNRLSSGKLPEQSDRIKRRMGPPREMFPSLRIRGSDTC